MTTPSSYHGSMRYEVVFRGKRVAGLDELTVQANLARLFRIEQTRAAALFSGKRVVLKRDLDRQTAEKYREALRRAGAVVAIVSAPDAASPQSEGSQTPGGSPPAAATPGRPAGPALAEPGVTLITQHRSEPPQIDTRGMTMAEPGAVVDETPRTPPAQIDTAHLQAEPVSEPLDSSQPPAPPSLSLDGLDLADETGVLDERPRAPRPEIDTSGLTASEIDGPIDVGNRPAPPRIDISGMKLDR